MVDPPKATKGRRMSKKTRKKSSKPAPKSRTTPARKPAAAKTASKTASKTHRKSRPRRRQDHRQKAAAKASPARRRQEPQASQDAPVEEARQGGQNRRQPSVAQAGIETVNKIQSIRLRPNRAARNRARSKAPRPPPSACPATAAAPSRWPTMRARNWCCSSIRAPTRPAAPGKPSTSPGSTSAFAEKAAAVLGVSADP